MTDKRKKRNANEEFGMEFGDINAVKYYELPEGMDKSKKKKKDSDKKNQHGCS
ncbi:hypothetical protein [Lederbergia galactosidilytica]|uniref:hypothetical protein n=1 Tax=Lederbergia galactosidilytica TaxID=217031 RepID=UPI000AC9CA5E|nr:hypothetical protein [Lederbergia galactosidilytica]MBP1917068.1 hypothetical protein [Lederbergia galactosidilytica]